MPPLSPPPPSSATHNPSDTSGDDEVKNRGTAPGKSSLRQSTFPDSASTHERTPPTPSVTTLPSATVGEHRGPEKLEAGPLAPRASYFSCQSSLPVAASRQRRISLPSWRENT